MSYVDKVLANMIEVELAADFNVVRETLTRIGVPDKAKKRLYQSCHILQKRGRYYICHFKEMFLIDGRPATISAEDLSRRNAVAYLLDQWGLVKILDREKVKHRAKSVFVLKFSEASNWELVSKYTFGEGDRKHQAA